MSIRREIENSTTITSGGGTSTSTKVSLEDDESLSIQVEGDANSNDLDFAIQAKVDSQDNWADLDNISKDVTSGSTNNEIFQYDVLDLEEFRVKTTNNAASDTVLTIITSQSNQE